MIVIPSLIESKKDVNQNIKFDSIEKKHPEILDIHSCKALGTIEFENDILFVDLMIDAELTLASTRTLKPIKYKLSFPLNLIFGDHDDADFILKDEIDLSQIIYGHIILEKPLSIYDEDEEVYVDKTKRVNPFFEELKDMKL